MKVAGSMSAKMGRAPVLRMALAVAKKEKDEVRTSEPGPTPSFRRTSAGTEIRPWVVSLDCAMAMGENYPR